MFGVVVNMLWQDRNTLIFDHHTDMDHTLWLRIFIYSSMNAYLRNGNNTTSHTFWSMAPPIQSLFELILAAT